KLDAPVFTPGKEATLRVTATRVPGFTGEIALAFVGLPPGVKPPPAKVPANTDSVEVKLALPAKAKPGPVLLAARGTAKHEGRDYTANAPPLTVTIKK